MATPEMKAAKQARQIERRGDTITMADGVTTIKAIVDTQPESTSNLSPYDIDRIPMGNSPGLFYVTAESYRIYMLNERQTVTRMREKWTMVGIPKNESFSDVSLVYVLLAYTGGNPA